MKIKTKVSPLLVTLTVIGSLAGGAMAQTCVDSTMSAAWKESLLVIGGGGGSSSGGLTTTGVGWDYTQGFSTSLNWETIGTGTNRATAIQLGDVNISNSTLFGIDTTGGGFDLTFSNPPVDGFPLTQTPILSAGAITSGTVDLSISWLGSSNFSYTASLLDSSGALVTSSLGTFSNSNMDATSRFEIEDQRSTQSTANGFQFVNAFGDTSTPVVTVCPVPEPSSALLCGLGAISLMLRRRK